MTGLPALQEELAPLLSCACQCYTPGPPEQSRAACQEYVRAISGTPKSQSDRRRFQHRPRLQTFPGPPKRRRFAGPSSSSAAGGLHMDLDVAGGQEAAVRRESVTVITRRATKPDAEAVHAYTGFAVVLHADVERVA
jgi:hypothetical protein